MPVASLLLILVAAQAASHRVAVLSRNGEAFWSSGSGDAWEAVQGNVSLDARRSAEDGDSAELTVEVVRGAERWAVELSRLRPGGMLIDVDLPGPGGLVHAALVFGGTARVTRAGELVSDSAMLRATALTTGYHADDSTFRSLPAGRSGDVELLIHVDGLPGGVPLEIGFEHPEVRVDGQLVPAAPMADATAPPWPGRMGRGVGGSGSAGVVYSGPVPPLEPPANQTPGPFPRSPAPANAEPARPLPQSPSPTNAGAAMPLPQSPGPGNAVPAGPLPPAPAPGGASTPLPVAPAPGNAVGAPPLPTTPAPGNAAPAAPLPLTPPPGGTTLPAPAPGSVPRASSPGNMPPAGLLPSAGPASMSPASRPPPLHGHPMPGDAPLAPAHRRTDVPAPTWSPPPPESPVPDWPPRESGRVRFARSATKIDGSGHGSTVRRRVHLRACALDLSWHLSRIALSDRG